MEYNKELDYMIILEDYFTYEDEPYFDLEFEDYYNSITFDKEIF